MTDRPDPRELIQIDRDFAAHRFPFEHVFSCVFTSSCQPLLLAGDQVVGCAAHSSASRRAYSRSVTGPRISSS
jgi:hypothetical protein